MIIGIPEVVTPGPSRRRAPRRRAAWHRPGCARGRRCAPGACRRSELGQCRRWSTLISAPVRSRDAPSCSTPMVSTACGFMSPMFVGQGTFGCAGTAPAALAGGGTDGRQLTRTAAAGVDEHAVGAPVRQAGGVDQLVQVQRDAAVLGLRGSRPRPPAPRGCAPVGAARPAGAGPLVRLVQRGGGGGRARARPRPRTSSRAPSPSPPRLLLLHKRAWRRKVKAMSPWACAMPWRCTSSGLRAVHAVELHAGHFELRDAQVREGDVAVVVAVHGAVAGEAQRAVSDAAAGGRHQGVVSVDGARALWGMKGALASSMRLKSAGTGSACRPAGANVPPGQSPRCLSTVMAAKKPMLAAGCPCSRGALGGWAGWRDIFAPGRASRAR